MKGTRCLLAVLLLLLLETRAAAVQESPQDFFSSPSVFELTLQAPLQELISRGRQEPDLTVPGKLLYRVPDGRQVLIDGVRVSLRGNTSLAESECEFPKLRLRLPSSRPPLFDDLDTLKIGTHCGNRRDGELTPKYGRWANEKAPHREAAVYRTVAAMGVPTLRARAARITYLSSDGEPAPLVRNALLLEDEERLLRRLGAVGEIAENAFSSASEMFSPADAARLAFVQAMIGNFDWCLRFHAGDDYRCNQRRPLWNVLALKTRTGAVPAMQDFDLAGMVTGRHLWFERTFSVAFSSARSEAEVEVQSQLQRTRRLFSREQLDRTRMELAGRKAAAYEAVAGSPLDEGWHSAIKTYMNAFFNIIEDDRRFYLPVVVSDNARFHLDAAGTRPACGGDKVPVGTPVSDPVELQQGRMRVIVLDAQWFWTPPRACDVIRSDAVWIDSKAVSREFPR
jgi:hypothetical protein